MPSFQIPVLGFLFVSFHPSLFHSHSCSTGACLLHSPSAFPLLFPLSFVRFFSGSNYSASVLPFSSSWPCLPVAFPVLRIFLSASPPSSFASAWFPKLRSRFLILGFLFVSFHPSRLRSHSCSTGASLFPLPFVHFFFGIFRLLSTFFRPLKPASNYSAFCPSFSLLPVFPWQRFLRCLSSSSFQPVSMPSFRLRYSVFCISFLRPPSRLTVATLASQPSSLRFPASSP